MMSRAVMALTMVMLLAGACGSDDGVDAELLPFSEVQASPFTFEADPTNPGRGIFRVTTTEPMICAIVWGETEAFGRFNNSLAMNGTGIVQHDVFLPDAEPGVEYVFRVQGTTADGRQFRSEQGTFTIPALDDPAAGAGEAVGENLAIGATVVETSSVFGPGWEGENAVDGDTGTEWSTAGDGDGGYIVVDLGEPREVGAVAFLTRSMLDGSAVTEQFTVTIDGGEIIGPFDAGTPDEPRPAETAFTGQVLRFDVETSTGGNVGAVEIQVFGSSPG